MICHSLAKSAIFFNRNSCHYVSHILKKHIIAEFFYKMRHILKKHMIAEFFYKVSYIVIHIVEGKQMTTEFYCGINS